MSYFNYGEEALDQQLQRDVAITTHFCIDDNGPNDVYAMETSAQNDQFTPTPLTKF